jgi:hypothetical protein
MRINSFITWKWEKFYYDSKSRNNNNRKDQFDNTIFKKIYKTFINKVKGKMSHWLKKLQIVSQRNM